MSTKRIWEIWCTGRKVMEKIYTEVPNVEVIFFFNDFCGMWEIEPKIYSSEMLNVKINKWVPIKRTRYNRIGKKLFFDHNLIKGSSIVEGYARAVSNMIDYIKDNPKP